MIFQILIAAILCFLFFYLGAFLGIRDCKKHYGIPKGITSDRLHIEVIDYGDHN